MGAEESKIEAGDAVSKNNSPVQRNPIFELGGSLSVYVALCLNS
jgi:hypothetical protein